ncbi:PAB1 binding protein [Malassezia yamatoensis]|uniref:PAB1 binding protein n=1 Tax=Malassezia yamatoensis TaxID=253288 RepID=A0AAJ5YXY5_9BASI|nr:PAB1 binding protein [Malassezia yamatoensis]
MSGHSNSSELGSQVPGNLAEHPNQRTHDLSLASEAQLASNAFDVTLSPSETSGALDTSVHSGLHNAADLSSSSMNTYSSFHAPSNSSYTPSVPAPIVIRALIITSDASIIIGKQGRHIKQIRELSNARMNISESIPSNPERILTVSGPLDAVSKAFGLLVRRINDEPFDQPSLPGSRAVTIRLIIPNSRMGSVIGKQGSKIKEIQEASGSRLNAGDTMLPGSTERILSITGVADAVHIAVYYVGAVLMEHQDRNANNLAYRPTAATRAISTPQLGMPTGLETQGSSIPSVAPSMAPTMASAAPSYGFGAPNTPPLSTSLPPGSQTQQIFIPNDLVGCIIGKGGQKINEIRQLSASHIKIMERGAGVAAGGTGSERLVTITGPPPNIQMAVTLLYQRLEQEKLRLAQAAGTAL